jgi:tetratricopeptide (TPR) repeat protein
MRKLSWKVPLQLLLISAFLIGLSTSTTRAQGTAQLTSFKFADDNQIALQKAWTTYRLALDKHRDGKDLEAVDALKRTIILNPRFAEAYNTLCVVYDSLSRRDEAITSCQQAIAAKSDFAAAFYNLGLVFDAAERPAEAIAALRHVLVLEPSHPEALYHLGQLYDRTRSYELAQQTLKRAIEVRPEYAAAYNELGFSYCAVGRFEEAIAAFQQAVATTPGEAHFQGNLGTAHYLAGHYAEAIASLSQAINTQPDLQIAQNNLGEVYLKTSQYLEAIDCFRRAINLGSDQSEFQPGIYNDLAAAYAHLAKYKKASELLAKAIQLKPDFRTAIFNLGVVDLILNDKAGAFHQYVALKALDPELAAKLYARISASRLIQVKPAERVNESP